MIHAVVLLNLAILLIGVAVGVTWLAARLTRA